ncbi:hypothetical protein NDU88_004144 [Pleurodeles waltl]|uniref:Uncharacterized protein n=1 Tax=Pleurodeles waltl TaxID=8319 RepID=A0AAV7L120_PLEWA|nr:hypothetical protein NDU88_004144 [Pleurodeles waltl]
MSSAMPSTVLSAVESVLIAVIRAMASVPLSAVLSAMASVPLSTVLSAVERVLNAVLRAMASVPLSTVLDRERLKQYLRGQSDRREEQPRLHNTGKTCEEKKRHAAVRSVCLERSETEAENASGGTRAQLPKPKGWKERSDERKGKETK